MRRVFAVVAVVFAAIVGLIPGAVLVYFDAGSENAHWVSEKAPPFPRQEVAVNLTSPGWLTSSVVRHCQEASAEELDALVTGADDTIAIAAGWERVRRTMPEETQDRLVPANEIAVSRFLGLVERRTHVQIPRIWNECVLKVDGYNRSWIRLPLVQALGISPENDSEDNKAAVDALPMLRRMDGHISDDGDTLAVEAPSGTFKFPVDHRYAYVDSASVAVKDDAAYVALHGSHPTPYSLYAVDRHSGVSLWSTEVRAGWMSVDFSGPGFHVVEMQVTDEAVAVFGIGCGAAYLETFDTKTGTRTCGFSTARFRFSQPFN